MSRRIARLILATLLILGAGAVPISAAGAVAATISTTAVSTVAVPSVTPPSDSQVVTATATYGTPLRTGGLALASPVVESGCCLDIPAGGVPALGGLVPPLVALRGVATYFPSCHRCAATSGELQAALGPRWQGMTVRVVHGGRHVDVRLVTGCGCGPRPMGPTVIDLSPDAFQALVPGKSIASIGVLRVVVVAGNVPALPPTDAAPRPVSPTWWGLVLLTAATGGFGGLMMLRRLRRPDPWRSDAEWQSLVDAVDLAAAIAWERPPRGWVIANNRLVPLAWLGAKYIADHYHMAVSSGNLPLDAIDGELFALDAALAEEGHA